MRDDRVTAGRSLRRRALVGTLLVVVGAAAVIVAMARPTAARRRVLGIGAAALVIGVLVLAPVLVGPHLERAGRRFVAALKPLGRLARGNVTRNPRRTANTAGALMIGMVLVGAASVMAASATGVHPLDRHAGGHHRLHPAAATRDVPEQRSRNRLPGSVSAADVPHGRAA